MYCACDPIKLVFYAHKFSNHFCFSMFVNVTLIFSLLLVTNSGSSEWEFFDCCNQFSQICFEHQQQQKVVCRYRFGNLESNIPGYRPIELWHLDGKMCQFISETGKKVFPQKHINSLNLSKYFPLKKGKGTHLQNQIYLKKKELGKSNKSNSRKNICIIRSKCKQLFTFAV